MNSHGPAGALGGIVMAGIALFLVGLIVQFAGTGWLTKLMPPGRHRFDCGADWFQPGKER